MSSTTDKPTAVVIDGYSAGNSYPAAFTAAGARVIHVQSTAELIPTMLAPNLSEYAENIVCTDPEALVELLRPYAPVCVVPGQESAVRLADRISDALGVASNGTELSPARRDKYEMIEALRRAGVRCAEQFKSGDPAAVVKWAEERGVYPVVVKPLSSAASDGVFVCESADDVRVAAERVLTTKDIFGHANTEALVQSYLKGTEYVVDTVSADGHHYTNAVWQYKKNLLSSGHNIYDMDILHPEDSDPVPALIAYVREVLAALKVAWGPSHAEVMVTAEGPVLVEIATRLNGNLNAAFQDECLGNNQPSLAAQAYTDPEAFIERYSGGVYRRLKSGIIYNSPTELDGVVASVDQTAVDAINALPSVYLTGLKVAPGARIRPTTDLLSSSMKIYLLSSSEEEIQADYEKIRALKDSVYRLAQ
ncbi:ATP-grasp domain-containing protein [Streptomyces sp. NPDC056909]|uniref:ATP-grasp domain-containing protein n=1 Tax=Streptomyces sp. NPDC056909 TaxID=3345963 RepID=UPI00367A9D00